jgi:hypothetical protein
MKRIGLPFSGKYGFAETKMYWPINHMVAPKEESLDCASCHNRTDSRIAALNDFYLPGRDKNIYIDTFAKFAIILALLGVAIHGAARFVVNNIKLDPVQGTDVEDHAAKKK